MSHIPTVTLRNGVTMPLLGFGVFQIADAEQCEEVVLNAIKTGYRSFDTAASYGNEEAVGRAIKRSGVPREELFITTKLWIKDASYEGAKKAFTDSLAKLQLDYLDLYLIHQPFGDTHGAWRAIVELYEAKKLRAIGVSNFNPDRLVDFILSNEVAPMINQVEVNPFNQQVAARQMMGRYNVQPEGWAPFVEGQHNIFSNDLLKQIGDKYGKSIAQVILRWHIQSKVVVIPKTTSINRMQENIDIFDFELDKDDMESIAALDEQRNFVDHRDPAFIEYLYNR